MSIFNFGGLLDGARKGFEYDKEFMAAVASAIKRKAWAELEALGAVAVENVKELGGEAKVLTEEQVAGLLLHPDPFAGSRHLFQQYQTRYGKK